VTETQPLSHPRDFRRSILGTALVAMTTWWGFGLPYSLFSWLLDPVQRGWVLICYAWEVPAAGLLGPVLVSQIWWRDVIRRWDRVIGAPGVPDAVETAVIEAARPQYQVARNAERIDVGRCCGDVHCGSVHHWCRDSCRTRCCSAGKLCRTSACCCRSICVVIQPRPRGKRCTTRPQ